MTEPSPYENSSQQTLLAVLEALSLRPLVGTTGEALATAAQISSTKAFRAVKNLELAGWAEAAPGGGWRLTPKASALSERVRVAIADLHREYTGDYR